ncbi:Leucine-rich repeat domain L domain-like [Trinorchestia longiramus]|nr:Leucine-rich repeat domain L domain-like [Trinorchestia longiramus]
MVHQKLQESSKSGKRERRLTTARLAASAAVTKTDTPPTSLTTARPAASAAVTKTDTPPTSLTTARPAASAAVTKTEITTHVHLQGRRISQFSMIFLLPGAGAGAEILASKGCVPATQPPATHGLPAAAVAPAGTLPATQLHYQKLQVLMVSHNCLTVVEGIPPSVSTLHVAHQTPLGGDSLLLDPLHISVLACTSALRLRTTTQYPQPHFAVLQENLTELNIRSNQLVEIQALQGLPNLVVRPSGCLVELDCGDNFLKDLENVCVVLKSLMQLRVLVLRGNPLYGNTAYWTSVTTVAPALEELDGRTVSTQSRLCLLKLALPRARKTRTSHAADAGAAGGAAAGDDSTEVDQHHNKHIFFTAEDRSKSSRMFGMYPSIAAPPRLPKKQPSVPASGAPAQATTSDGVDS